jgi:hypothetical protein
LPGLKKLVAKKMDARVNPAHDDSRRMTGKTTITGITSSRAVRIDQVPDLYCGGSMITSVERWVLSLVRVPSGSF